MKELEAKAIREHLGIYIFYKKVQKENKDLKLGELQRFLASRTEIEKLTEKDIEGFNKHYKKESSKLKSIIDEIKVENVFHLKGDKPRETKPPQRSQSSSLKLTAQNIGKLITKESKGKKFTNKVVIGHHRKKPGMVK